MTTSPASRFRCCVLGSVLLLAGTHGCGSEAPAEGATISRDSAGVTLVESGAPFWNLTEGWSVPSEPVFELGLADGPEAYQFHRVTSTLLLPRGGVAVADGGSREIRIFADDGSHIRTFGGLGDGPGEFRNVSFIALIGGDSLLAWDPILDRATLFDVDGGLGRIYRAPDLGVEFVLLTDAFADGSLVGLADQGIGRETPPGLVEARMTLVRTTASRADTIARVPSGLSYISVSHGWVMMDVPFTPRRLYDAEGETLYYGYGDFCEVRVYTLTGRLARIHRYPCTREPITAADFDEFIELSAGRIDDPGSRRAMAARLEEVPRQARFPAFSELVADEVGNTWLAAYRPGEDGYREWTVLDRTGRLLGPVKLPGDLTVQEIGDDYILGVVRDSLDVERVAMYSIQKY